MDLLDSETWPSLSNQSSISGVPTRLERGSDDRGDETTVAQRVGRREVPAWGFSNSGPENQRTERPDAARQRLSDTVWPEGGADDRAISPTSTEDIAVRKKSILTSRVLLLYFTKLAPGTAMPFKNKL